MSSQLQKLSFWQATANCIPIIILYTYWIAGHVDRGENERQAALRETEEEAGITVDQLQLYEDFKTELHYEVRGKPKRVIYWLSELKNPNYEVKLSHEHKDLKWLNLKDALDIARYEDMKQALVKADDYITTSVVP